MFLFAHVYLQLLVYVAVVLDSPANGCLQGPLTAGSTEHLHFEAFPGINAVLGEQLQLRCSVKHSTNSTSVLRSITVHSRRLGELNSTCNIHQDGGHCHYTIPKLQLWHNGTYDCITFYKDMKCFSRTLVLSLAHPSYSTPTTKVSTHEHTQEGTSDMEATQNPTMQHSSPSDEHSTFRVEEFVTSDSETTMASGTTWTTVYLSKSILALFFLVCWLLMER